MFITRLCLLIGLFLGQAAVAVPLASQCPVIYLSNHSQQALQVTVVYPESESVLRSFILQPNTIQQKRALETIGSCKGNTTKLHCHAVWKQCHKQAQLQVISLENSFIRFSASIQANDVISFNSSPSNDRPIMLINDVIYR